MKSEDRKYKKKIGKTITVCIPQRDLGCQIRPTILKMSEVLKLEGWILQSLYMGSHEGDS